MNEFSNQLGTLAQSIGKEYALTAPDDAAALVRRARRGRVVWTGAVGTASLAGAAAVAFGGSAAASSVFNSTAEPAHHELPAAVTPSHDPAPEAVAVQDDTATPTPTPTPTPEKTHSDDPATHEKAEHAAGAHKHKSDDVSKHKGNKADCDVKKGDDSKRDHAEDGAHHHKHGNDDSKADDNDDHGNKGSDDAAGSDDSGGKGETETGDDSSQG